MQKIEYFDFYFDTGCSYSSVAGNYTSIDKMQECLKQSEHLFSVLWNNFCHQKSSTKYEKTDKTELILNIKLLEQPQWHDAFAEVIPAFTNVRASKYETVIIPEVKLEGFPYSPEKREQKIVSEEIIDILPTITLVVYKKTIYLDGVPTSYGKIIGEEE